MISSPTLVPKPLVLCYNNSDAKSISSYPVKNINISPLG